MIKRHIESCFLEFTDGRSDKAARLHLVTRNDRQSSAAVKLQTIDKSFASVSGGDYWAEKGEAGKCVRVHTHPRTSAFVLWKVPGGPGRRNRLTHERSTRGVDSRGRQFRIHDSWDEPTMNSTAMQTWTGRTIFVVDVGKIHTDRWGPTSGGRGLRRQTSRARKCLIWWMKKFTQQSLVLVGLS